MQDKTLLNSNDSDGFSAEYQRSLDVALIKYMESELDLSSPGTKAELRSLNDQIFKRYFDRVQTAHKQLWVANKLKEKRYVAYDKLSNDIAVLQANDRDGFDNSLVNGTGGQLAQANGAG